MRRHIVLKMGPALPPPHSISIFFHESKTVFSQYRKLEKNEHKTAVIRLGISAYISYFYFYLLVSSYWLNWAHTVWPGLAFRTELRAKMFQVQENAASDWLLVLPWPTKSRVSLCPIQIITPLVNSRIVAVAGKKLKNWRAFSFSSFRFQWKF